MKGAKTRTRILLLLPVLCLFLYLFLLSRVLLRDDNNINTIDQVVLEHGIITKSRANTLSSVDYIACCGAGHRLSKTAEAFHLSKRLGFSLRVFWGYCTNAKYKNVLQDVQVYQYLFGPQSLTQLTNVTDTGRYLRINNEVVGYKKLQRLGNKRRVCDLSKVASDVDYFRDLSSRFVGKGIVDDFVRRKFGNTNQAVVVGLHIRAGNNETGDFSSRGRNIELVDTWLENITKHVRSFNASVVFLATDTAEMIKKVRALLEPTTTVVTYDQSRPDQGVFFGERGNVLNRGNICLHNWRNTFVDMMILSRVNIVLAARPSSFSQSLPMHLVLPIDKQIHDNSGNRFCEFSLNGKDMQCFTSIKEWCYTGQTLFSLAGIQQYEYIRMPDKIKPDQLQFVNRTDCGPKPEQNKQRCLPYDWSDYIVQGRQVTLRQGLSVDNG